MIDVGNAVLRPLEPGDLGRLYEFRNDTEVISQLGGFTTGYSRKDLDEWLETHRKREDEVLWAISTKNDSACIGHAGLYQIDSRVRKAEYAILIGDKQHQGKGLGKTVSRAVLAFGFEELNLHCIFGRVLATNARAIKNAESEGMRRDGIFRDEQYRGGKYIDVLLYSILDVEWMRTPDAREKP